MIDDLLWSELTEKIIDFSTIISTEARCEGMSELQSTTVSTETVD